PGNMAAPESGSACAPLLAVIAKQTSSGQFSCRAIGSPNHLASNQKEGGPTTIRCPRAYRPGRPSRGHAQLQDWRPQDGTTRLGKWAAVGGYVLFGVDASDVAVESDSEVRASLRYVRFPPRSGPAFLRERRRLRGQKRK